MDSCREKSPRSKVPAVGSNIDPPQLRTPQADVGAGELAIERGVAAGALSAEVRDELLRDMAA